jgi:hypothetical protein
MTQPDVSKIVACISAIATDRSVPVPERLKAMITIGNVVEEHKLQLSLDALNASRCALGRS